MKKLPKVLESSFLIIEHLTRILFQRAIKKVKTRRFILLTPYGRKRQFVFDLELKVFHNYEIETWSDWITGYQVFGQESYNLKRVSPNTLEQNLKSHQDSESNFIIDLGGNIGLASLYFALTYPEAMIKCVEIDPGNVKLAKKNLERYSRVEVLNIAIASRNGEGFILRNHSSENNAFEFSFDKSEEAVESVRAINVGELFRIAGKKRAKIVKVDIEGSEKELFSQNTEWVREVDVIIMEPHDWLYPGQEITRNFLSVVANDDRDFLIDFENVFSIKSQI
jgi:FkbM family methyltransferase